ncbi:MAG TPA: hypothetical protein VFR33_06415 [Candidatus Dormibacteraeota bacterium]|nr:hypothetical protein [Candidatus Dormibacteraeota bacterium]
MPHLDRALAEARRVLRSRSPFAASVPIGGGQGLDAIRLLDSVIDRWLPPVPEATDRSATRAMVAEPDSFRRAALDAGFADVQVEVIEESVRWESADQLVALCTSWWVCAAQLDRVDDQRREDFITDALTTLRQEHQGPIETTGRNIVLSARSD